MIIMVVMVIALKCAAEGTSMLLRRAFFVARGFGPGFSATWGVDDCRDATKNNHHVDTTFYLLCSASLKLTCKPMTQVQMILQIFDHQSQMNLHVSPAFHLET